MEIRNSEKGVGSGPHSPCGIWNDVKRKGLLGRLSEVCEKNGDRKRECGREERFGNSSWIIIAKKKNTYTIIN